MLRASICILMLTLFGTTTYAEKPPEAYKQEADQYLFTAFELAKQANRTLQSGLDRSSAKHAINLYVEAGKHFDQAHSIYKALGPQRVSPQDIEKSAEGLQLCLKRIQEIKAHLS